MNKTELIEAMAADAGITKAAAKAALESFTNHITKTLKNDGKVALVGWGSWTVSQRAARTGRNPKTGDSVPIPARKVVKFRSGTGLNNDINNK